MVKNRLLVKDLSCYVSLGCSAEERATAQEVRVSLQLDFLKSPLATLSDQLNGTVCFDQLSRQVTHVCERQAFNTIEFLANQIYLQLKETLGLQAKLLVTVHKVKPPIAQLQGGVFFTFGDDSGVEV